ncbi:MAG: hypothetical protein Q7T01_02890 [bacterium]|nr:hypothetical protein [bacterium]
MQKLIGNMAARPSLFADSRRAVAAAKKAGRQPAAFHLAVLQEAAKVEQRRNLLHLKARCR